MGKRARKGGIANKAVRVAKSAAMARDKEAQRIASMVYALARSVKGQTGIPLEIYAPLQLACELAAFGVVRSYGLGGPENSEEEHEAVGMVAAYLRAGFTSMIATFRLEHFEEWKATLPAIAAEEEVKGGV